MLPGHPVTFSIFVSAGSCWSRGFRLSCLTSARSQPGQDSRRLVTNALLFFLFDILPLSPHYNTRKKVMYTLEELSLSKLFEKNCFLIFFLLDFTHTLNYQCKGLISDIWLYYSSFCLLMLLTYMPVFTLVVPIDRAAVYSRRQWMINKCRNVEGRNDQRWETSLRRWEHFLATRVNHADLVAVNSEQCGRAILMLHDIGSR